MTLDSRLKTVLRTLREIAYGATGYEFERQAARLRADLENVFMFMVVGDTIGVPILPPYYALRLVPYLVGVLPMWQRRILRERNPLDTEEFDLHGV
jgi:hypothetical protein